MSMFHTTDNIRKNILMLVRKLLENITYTNYYSFSITMLPIKYKMMTPYKNA